MKKARSAERRQAGIIELLEPRRLLSGDYVQIIVNQTLYGSIRPWVDTYQADLQAEGYTADVVSRSFSSAADMRNYLAGVRQAHSTLDGVVLIGDLPMVLFEARENPTKPTTQFACDLYFMDLDGTWSDTSGNGILDSHPNDGLQTPEIWISRILTHRSSGNQIELATEYLNRVHDYRTGALRFDERALLYVDDDWQTWASEWQNAINQLYPGDVTTVSDPATTTAADFRSHLQNDDLEWLRIAVHSSEYGMSFGPGDDRGSEGTVFANEIPGINPHIGFFDFYECRFANYNVGGFGAGRYMFNTEFGLAGIGPTKDGALQHGVQEFYALLGNGHTMGQAFRDWMTILGRDGYASWESWWEFGMSVIGDGTLSPTHPQNLTTSSTVPIDSVLATSGRAELRTIMSSRTNVHRYTFTGRAGDVVKIQVKGNTTTDWFDPAIALFGPGQTPRLITEPNPADLQTDLFLRYSDDNPGFYGQHPGTDPADIDMVLLQDGTYTIQVQVDPDAKVDPAPALDSTTGPYTLTITQRHPNPARQPFYLNFDGLNANDITGEFPGLPGTPESQLSQIISATASTFADIFRDYDIPVSTTPPSSGEYSTILFARADGPGDDVLGRASGVDYGNAVRNDTATVFWDHFVPGLSYASAAQVGRAFGAAAAHLAGLLLGLRHVDAAQPAGDLMGATLPALNELLSTTRFGQHNLYAGQAQAYHLPANAIENRWTYGLLDTAATLLRTVGPEMRPPAVSSITHRRTRDTDITIVFDDDMSLSTLTSANIQLVGSASGTHNWSADGAYDAATRTLVIHPSTPFAAGETVTLTLSTGVRDREGNSLDGDQNGTSGPNKVHTFQVGSPQQELAQNGIDWLRANKSSWLDHVAEASMAVLAMLNGGYDESDPVVAEGITCIRSQIGSGGIVGSDFRTTAYHTALAMLPLIATHNTAYQQTLIAMRDALIGLQWDENSPYGSISSWNASYGGFGYGSTASPDLATTQWALTALSAADTELKISASSTYSKAVAFLDRCRDSDGGGSSSPGGSATHTATAALVWSYYAAGVRLTDSRISQATQWLSDRYSVANPDCEGAAGACLYHLTLAKAMVGTHTTNLAGHDWFNEIYAALLSQQRPGTGGGYWPATSLSSAEMNTAWAALALQTRTLPVEISQRVTITLQAPGDLHIYDAKGNHIGVNYATMSIENTIPGATYQLFDPSGSQVPYPGATPGPGFRQVITLSDPAAATFGVQVAGTGSGSYTLDIAGQQNDSTVTAMTYTGGMADGLRISTSMTVTAMHGPMTLLYEPVTAPATLSVTVPSSRITVMPGTVQTIAIPLKEVGGQKGLNSVQLHATDFAGPGGTISQTTIGFSANQFDLAAGSEKVVYVTIPIPSGLTGTATGQIRIETANAGSKALAFSLVVGANTLSITDTTTNEDTQTSSGLTITHNPGLDGMIVSHFKITGINNGTLFLHDGITPIANNAFITYAQGQAGLRFTPASNFYGTASFTVQGSYAGSDAGLSGPIAQATILVRPVNDVPTPRPDAYDAKEDTGVISGNVLANDGDSEGDCTARLISAPSHGDITFQSNGAFSYTLNANYSGTDTFTYRVWDNGANAFAGEPVMVTITVAPVNDAPFVMPVPPQTVHAGTPLRIELGGSDVDGDRIAYRLLGSQIPEGAQVDPVTGVFTWTPTRAHVRRETHHLVVEAMDDHSSDPQWIGVHLYITVTDTPPRVHLVGPDQGYGLEGRRLSFTGNVENPAGGQLTYNWTIRREGREDIRQTTKDGIYSFTPDDDGSYAVMLVVTDDKGLSGTDSLAIAVMDVLPTVQFSSAQQAHEGSDYTLVIDSVSDPGNDRIVGYTINWGDGSNTQNFTGSPAGMQHTHQYADGPNTYDIQLFLMDEDEHPDPVLVSFPVEVLNTAPSATFSSSGSVDEGSPAVVSFTDRKDPGDENYPFAYSFALNPADLAGVYVDATGESSCPFIFQDEGTYTVYGRIFDKDGGYQDYTTEIAVRNAKPVVDAGADAVTSLDAAFVRTGSFADPGHDLWTATVDYGDGEGPQPLSLKPDKTFTLNHTYESGGEHRVVVTVVDDDGGSTSDSFTVLVETSLRVVSFTPTASGFVVQFNRPVNPHLLNLYDGVDSSKDLPDLQVVGKSTGPVAGSLLWDPDHNTATYVKTGGLLAADTYTVTLFSRADGWVDTAGGLLDGENDSVPGGNYIATFATSLAADKRILSMPDFARGPGQPVNVLGADTGLPLRISNAANAFSIDFELVYDPRILTISDATLAPGMPSSWAAYINADEPGRVFASLSGVTALPAKPLNLILLKAIVPSDAPYAASQAIRFENIRINEGSDEAASYGDVTVHTVAYLGDGTGNGRYSGLDASAIASIVARKVTGFDAYPLVDPLIIGETTGNDSLSPLDASYVAQKVAGRPRPEIPSIPAAPSVAPTPASASVSSIQPTQSLAIGLQPIKGVFAIVPIRQDSALDQGVLARFTPEVWPFRSAGDNQDLLA